MKLEEIKELMKAMEESGLSSLDYNEGEVHLSLRRGSAAGDVPQAGFAGAGAAAGGFSAAAAPLTAGSMPAANGAGMGAAPAAASAAGGSTGAAAANSANSGAGTNSTAPEAFASEQVVTSPLVGTFYASSAPDKEAFVKVGDHVKKGQVLGIIEAMKLMNEIESEYDGVVESILVNNEEVVEFGQPLFRIR